MASSIRSREVFIISTSISLRRGGLLNAVLLEAYIVTVGPILGETDRGATALFDLTQDFLAKSPDGVNKRTTVVVQPESASCDRVDNHFCEGLIVGRF
jgi:hypothetical protein